jgi:hypothetical protein
MKELILAAAQVGWDMHNANPALSRPADYNDLKERMTIIR